MLSEAKRVVRRSVKRALRSPYAAALRRYYAGVGTCLVYHRVVSDGARRSSFDPYAGLTVSADQFRSQMRYLRTHQTVIPLGELIRRLRAGTLRPGSVAVTFDDGYRDNLTVALPILEECDVPATIFVSTGLVENSTGLWWYDLARLIERHDSVDCSWGGRRWEFDLGTLDAKMKATLELNEVFKSLHPYDQATLFRALDRSAEYPGVYAGEMMSWDELAFLAEHPLISIGAHTVGHPVLSRLDRTELDFELRESRRILSERIRKTVSLFAYPYGGVGQASLREFRAAARAGFEAAFTTRFSHLFPASHMAALPRIGITNTETPETFADKLSGLTSLLCQGPLPRYQ